MPNHQMTLLDIHFGIGGPGEMLAKVMELSPIKPRGYEREQHAHETSSESEDWIAII